jgi:hypothetical protein
MKPHRLGYIAFLAFIGYSLMSGPADSSLRRSYGCVGVCGGNCGGVGGGACGGNGGVGGAANGVVVDARGVLHNEVFEQDEQLARERVMAARAKLDKRVAATSKLRKISLNRLEAALADRLGKRQPPTDEMMYLAGLTRCKYVFYYPETKDIVLAGPAEAWAADAAGRVRGIDSGWTTLELQDLAVALRAYPPSKPGAQVILISIDPTPEGLARMQQFLRQWGSQATPDQTDFIVDGLRTSLGMQNIRVAGIAPNTHFAQVLIEADYRMKLIGIGLERPPVRIKSYVDAANPAMVSRSALQRWYFVPDYKCVKVAADALGMELVGNGVKLVGEDQLVAQDGSRAATKHGNKASDTFVNGFTAKYAEMAIAVPVYAQMRNCVDLAVAAAFIQKHEYYAKAGWTQGVLGNEQAYAVETLNVPQHTETVVASIWRGNRLMTPVGGGVTMHPREALETSNLLADEDGKVNKTRDAIQPNQLPPGQWWWD